MNTKTAAVLVACALPGTVVAADITLIAGEEPEQKAWTQPAAITYIDNADSKDVWNVDAALRISGQPFTSLPFSQFVRVVVQRSTETKKPVENYAGEIGGKFDLYPGEKTWIYGQGSIAYADKTNFPDADADCSAIPLPADCLRQRERSIRPTFTVQPFRSNWEKTYAAAGQTNNALIGDGWTYSFLPTISLFYDEVLEAKLNAAGVEPSGGVLGSKVAFDMAVSPRFTDYRLVFASNVQYISAFDRSTKRKDGFAANSTLVTASITYQFGPRAFVETKGWVPSFGLTYKKGDDPLAGKKDLDNVSVGLKITYRSK